MTTVDDLHRVLIQLLDSIGEYKIEHKKESMHVVRERAFLGIHPKKSYLGVNVVLNRPKANPKASKVDQVSTNRFHHFFRITGTKELNRSFALLLREAYNLAEPNRPRKT